MRAVSCRRGLMLILGGLLGLTAVGLAAAAAGDSQAKTAPEDPEYRERLQMVASQIEARGIRDPRVLAAMRKVPRHRFVRPDERAYAYSDGPLPIGLGQTISQPYIVALMTELLRPRAGMKVLEVGTGSGYQAAVLAECVGQVYTIEILADLGRQAESLLRDLGYSNVHVRIGDGFDGWPDQAPFAGILVTAAPEEIPRPLLEQLEVGGRLVIPVGRGTQDLVLVTRTGPGPRDYERKVVTAVRFVPMTGKSQER